MSDSNSPGEVTPLLEVKELKRYFTISRSRGLRTTQFTLKAVDGINLSVYPGETLALVGESGCGKTTAARCILRLQRPTSGAIKLLGKDFLAMRGEELRKMRQCASQVFQDPYAALNPRLQVGSSIMEPISARGNVAPNERLALVQQLMVDVGLPADALHRYPHEFSGGQRQRIGIARAIAGQPALVILDEPTSALDVSVRAQILNLLADLQTSRNLSYLLIAHDLSVVRHAAHRVAVMYLGRIVESGSVDDVFLRAAHPYTAALLAAAPRPVPDAAKILSPPAGETPSPIDVPSGCRFHPRCPFAKDICRTEDPAIIQLSTPGHETACHFPL